MCTKCNFPCYQQSSLSARFLGCLIVTQPQTHASQRLFLFRPQFLHRDPMRLCRACESWPPSTMSSMPSRRACMNSTIPQTKHWSCRKPFVHQDTPLICHKYSILPVKPFETVPVIKGFTNKIELYLTILLGFLGVTIEWLVSSTLTN